MQSSNSESRINDTVKGYDQIAAEFAARWADLRLERALTTFLGHLGGQRRVLDLGCGPGRDVAFLADLGCHVTGLDLSAGMLAQARRRLPLAPLVRGDQRRPPFASARFDGVWACASLLNLPKTDFPAALSAVARLLGRRGVLYLALKGGQGETWVRDPGGRRFFFAYYQPDEVEGALRRAGFRVLESWRSDDAAGREHPWLSFVAER